MCGGRSVPTGSPADMKGVGGVRYIGGMERGSRGVGREAYRLAHRRRVPKGPPRRGRGIGIGRGVIGRRGRERRPQRPPRQRPRPVAAAGATAGGGGGVSGGAAAAALGVVIVVVVGGVGLGAVWAVCVDVCFCECVGVRPSAEEKGCSIGDRGQGG